MTIYPTNLSTAPLEPDLPIDPELIWLACRRNWWLAVGAFTAVVGLAVGAASLREPSYSASGKLLFRIDQTPLLTGIRIESSELSSLVQQSNPLLTETEVLQSEPLLTQVITDLDLRTAEGDLRSPLYLSKRLTIGQAGDADILDLSFEGEIAEETAAVVNRLMEVYIDNTVERSRGEAMIAREFLATQIPETEAALQATEERLRQFRESRGVVDLASEARSTVEGVTEFDRDIANYEGRLSSVISRISEIEGRLGMSLETALAVSTVSQAPGVQSVLAELQTVEAALSLNLTRFQANSPTVVSLQEEATALRELLDIRVREVTGVAVAVGLEDLQVGDLERTLIGELASLEAERLGLISRIATLQNSRAEILERGNNLPSIEQQQREIQRELDAIQVTYETLLTRREELAIAENQGIVNASVLEEATVPLEPNGDESAILIILAGIVFGGLLGVTTIFVRELIDPSIKTAKGVKEAFSDFTVVGTIPTFKQARKSLPANTTVTLPLRDAPYSPLSEMYRNVQSTLDLRGYSTERLSVLTIASSVPGEGKSTITANLALAVAELGRSVLIIDADLRNPSQTQLWGMEGSSSGLVELMLGKASCSEVLLSINPYLQLLPAGQQRVNPSSLLQSSRFVELLRKASHKFDFVIVDTPPLGVATDALIVGQLSDGILMVARPGSIDDSSAALAKNALLQSEQMVLGLVLNGIDSARSMDSSFHKLERYYSTSSYAPVQPNS